MFLNLGMKYFIPILFLFGLFSNSQSIHQSEIYSIIKEIDSERIKNDIDTLANFGTRHTLSDTISNTRGIGAARRWIKDEFVKISDECGGCLEVFFQKNYFEADGRRLIRDVWINNVVAIQR